MTDLCVLVKSRCVAAVGLRFNLGTYLEGLDQTQLNKQLFRDRLEKRIAWRARGRLSGALPFCFSLVLLLLLCVLDLGLGPATLTCVIILLDLDAHDRSARGPVG